jgi:hypothetical protein
VSTTWLNQDRWNAPEFTPAPQEVDAAGLHGPLRGVDYIDLARLTRALHCVVTPIENGVHVFDPEGRNVREGKDEGAYVNLDDRDMERCYCYDFVFRCDNGDSMGREPSTVCKHILAACLHHPQFAAQLDPYLTQITTRNSIAAALQQPLDQDAT